MRKNHLIKLIRDSLSGKFMAFGMAAASLMFVSCTVDPLDKESYESEVRNQTLLSPSTDDIIVTASPDGTQTTISWPVVYGAKGYLCSVYNVSDLENPVAVYEEALVDGCSLTIARAEETNYEFNIQTLGREDLNNKDAETKTTVAFTSFIPSVATIPSGTDLYEYFQSNPLESSADEQPVDLQSNGTYTISQPLDFGDNYVTLRSTGKNATITCAPGACMIFGNGIKLQNLNIDNTDNTANGLLLMSSTPNEAQSTEALGYKDKGANQSGYVMTNPVTLKNVNVKNLQKSLIYGNKTNWSLISLIIDKCMIQLANEESMGVINMYGASNGLIKNLTIKNSTFYNLKENNAAYFLRYGNSSNAQPQKIFGKDETAALNLTNNTFANVFTAKDFANNLSNSNLTTTTLESNIFYDVFRVYQFVQTNTIRKTLNNYIWWVKTSKQNNDVTRTDSNGNPICTEANPGFKPMEELSPLDFTAPNNGVDFTPTGVPFDNKAGDPRWLPTEVVEE